MILVFTPQDLSSEKFIFREQGSATRADCCNYENSELMQREVMEIENPESVKKAAQNGLGIAFPDQTLPSR